MTNDETNDKATSRHDADVAADAGTSDPSPLARPTWVGEFAGKRPAVAELVLTQPLQRSSRGGSGSFLGVANDGKRYWVKTLNNGQHPRVCVTEQIVGRIGLLIGAPTCPVRTIELPAEVTGWEFMRDKRLEVGIAHASGETPTAIETNQLDRRTDDDNSSRHAFILALYDLCWGGDCQWLVNVNAENAYWSHDHGWYLPPTGPTWTEAALSREIAQPHMHSDDGKNLSVDAVKYVSARLRELSKSDLVAALSTIPSTWPVTDSELEAVGHFVLSRATSVADRLKTAFLGGGQ